MPILFWQLQIHLAVSFKCLACFGNECRIQSCKKYRNLGTRFPEIFLLGRKFSAKLDKKQLFFALAKNFSSLFHNRTKVSKNEKFIQKFIHVCSPGNMKFGGVLVITRL